MRCDWAKNELAIRYHDEEWGVPVHDDRTFFEFLILEGAQAGLSWDTVLAKRENYRAAYDGFVPEKVAEYGEADVARLLANPGIIRNRAKVASSIGNARAFLKIQAELGSFDRYVWRFVDGHPKIGRWTDLKQIQPTTPESDALSKDLLKRGFKFVGSTICYAFLQATGLVDDHLVTCLRYRG